MFQPAAAACVSSWICRLLSQTSVTEQISCLSGRRWSSGERAAEIGLQASGYSSLLGKLRFPLAAYALRASEDLRGVTLLDTGVAAPDTTVARV